MKFLPSQETIKAFSKYLLLGTTIFALGLLWNFPYERIRDSLTSALTRQTGYRVDMATLSPALPIGFRATNARIQGPPLGGNQPVDLELSRLRVTASPFSLLLYPFRKSITLWYSADYNKNAWSGAATFGRSFSSVDLKTKEFRLERSIPMQDINPLFAGADLRFVAKLSLTTNLGGETPLLTRGDLSTSDGAFQLTASDVTIKGPVINELRFEKITIDSALQKGKLEIRSVNLSGPDITGTANGSLKIEPYFPRSQIHLESKLTISDRARALRDLIASLGQAYGIKMNDQGTFALRVEGPISPADRLSVRGF